MFVFSFVSPPKYSSTFGVRCKLFVLNPPQQVSWLHYLENFICYQIYRFFYICLFSSKSTKLTDQWYSIVKEARSQQRFAREVLPFS